MALNKKKILKWVKMVVGKSEFHVNQKLGKKFNPNKIEGYFNDMTEKVDKWKLFDKDGVPMCEDEKGEKFYFPVAIFQYGLGAYDKYLILKEDKYYEMFKKCVNWTITNQDENGGWNNFYYIFPNNPYSAMAQGEAISLLIRSKINDYKKEECLSSIKKGKFFLLSNNKILNYDSFGNLILYEYSHLPVVLNGWIFAFFGLYDLYLFENSKTNERLVKKSLESIENYIKEFDLGKWSKYNIENKITSKFYHDLQISQLKALYLISKNKNFKEVLERWEKGLNNKMICLKYFLIKAYQKIIE